jgi:hypothetical protein
MCLCHFLPEHLFCLSRCKTNWTMSVDNLGLEICPLGTSNSMVNSYIFFFPWRSLTSNRNFYRALKRLHGPWCKQPLRVHFHVATRPLDSTH